MSKWFWASHNAGYPCVTATCHGDAVEALRELVVSGIAGVEKYVYVAPDDVYRLVDGDSDGAADEPEVEQ